MFNSRREKRMEGNAGSCQVMFGWEKVRLEG